VGRVALARQVLGHVARDVSHEALGRPLEAVDGFSSPGELLRASLGDEVPRPLEGAVVYRALAARRLLDLLLRVGDGAAAGFHLRGLAAGLLAILLLDVLAGDGGVALLERALLDARPDAPLFLPLFQSVEESFGVVGPVKLAAVVDLGEVQVALARVGLRDLPVYRVEVGGPGAADGASGRLASGDVAADVAFEAVEALGGATDLFLHPCGDSLDVSLVLGLAEAAAPCLEDLLLRRRVVSVGMAVGGAVTPLRTLVEVLEEGVYGLILTHRFGGAHLVADGAHGLHRAGREDALYYLVYDAGCDDGVALLDGVPDDGACRHAHYEAGDAVQSLEGLFGPGHVLLCGVEIRRLVLEVGYEDVRRQVAHHVLGVPADVHLVV